MLAGVPVLSLSYKSRNFVQLNVLWTISATYTSNNDVLRTIVIE